MSFEPKLIFLINPSDGIPMDASLSTDTRAYLLGLVAKAQEAPSTEVFSLGKEINPVAAQNQPKVNEESSHAESSKDIIRGQYQRVEVPLRYDGKFFRMLNLELSGLQNLQEEERSGLIRDIRKLGEEISKAASPPNGFNKTDLYTWREIISLYTDLKIFFSTNEQEIFCRHSSEAQKQLQVFSDNLREIKLARNFRNRNSFTALDRFLRINLLLLQNLKFQELNSIAITKIIKSKFEQSIK